MDKEIAELIERIFVEGKTYEVVVTTRKDRGKGQPNAAALGIVRNGTHFELKTFKGSDTFDNLRSLKRLGINVITVEQVDLLARAALKGWGSAEAEFGDDEYENLRGFPFLKTAAIQLDCKAEDWTENYGKDDYGDFHVATFSAVPEAYKLNSEGVKPIERGTVAVLEALVFATRWKVAKGEVKEFLFKRLKFFLERAVDQGGDANLLAVDLIDGFLSE